MPSRLTLAVLVSGLVWLLTLWGSTSPQPTWLGIPIWYWRAGGLLLLLIPVNAYGVGRREP
ncbi:MAG: hypothetical protein Q6K70_07990 [Thermostichales cyanobacterium DRC_bins_46]